ncbi:hypothetical protein Zmor_001121 [Zophobas morio]|uniref:Uncharacterized protein n=1 Tax=Zophobas morio TaxID=2755281 RepID=A0AA38MSE9_9CUCU|nr:hypothetical protein Zmor_001121 [Zophobas morio]
MYTINQEWAPIICPLQDNPKLYNLTWHPSRNSTNPIHIHWRSHEANTISNISTTMTSILLPMNCEERQTITLMQYNPDEARFEKSQTLTYQPRCQPSVFLKELEQYSDILIIVFGLIIINLLLCYMINLYHGSSKHSNSTSEHIPTRTETPTFLEVTTASERTPTSKTLTRTLSNITWRSNYKENPVYMENNGTSVIYDFPKPATRIRDDMIINDFKETQVYASVQQSNNIQKSPQQTKPTSSSNDEMLHPFHTYSNVPMHQGLAPRKNEVIEVPTTFSIERESETKIPELSQKVPSIP